MSCDRRILASGRLGKYLLLAGAFLVWLLLISTTNAQDNAAEPRSDDAQLIGRLFEETDEFDLRTPRPRGQRFQDRYLPAEAGNFVEESCPSRTLLCHLQHALCGS